MGAPISIRGDSRRLVIANVAVLPMLALFVMTGSVLGALLLGSLMLACATLAVQSRRARIEIAQDGTILLAWAEVDWRKPVTTVELVKGSYSVSWDIRLWMVIPIQFVRLRCDDGRIVRFSSLWFRHRLWRTVWPHVVAGSHAD